MTGRTVGELSWPGMRSEYAVVPPHEGTTVTGSDQIGVAFSAHPAVRYRHDGRAGTAAIVPGSAVVSGGADITWTAVREPTEALEIYPDADLVAAAAAELSSGPVRVTPAIGRPDAVVFAVGTVLRRAHLGVGALTDVGASTLAHRLTAHLLERYGGLAPRHPPGRLAARTVDRVLQRVQAGLADELSLEVLAEVARLSPFHFARAFRETTGLPPHQLVTAVRMNHALALIVGTRVPVAEVAARVGFSNVGHFRRLFVRHHGVGPSAVRTARSDLVTGRERRPG